MNGCELLETNVRYGNGGQFWHWHFGFAAEHSATAFGFTLRCLSAWISAHGFHDFLDTYIYDEWMEILEKRSLTLRRYHSMRSQEDITMWNGYR